MNILLVGNGAREHVIAESFKKNKDVKLFSFMKSKNPGIASLSDDVLIDSYSNLEEIKKFAEKNGLTCEVKEQSSKTSNILFIIKQSLS